MHRTASHIKGLSRAKCQWCWDWKLLSCLVSQLYYWKASIHTNSQYGLNGWCPCINLQGQVLKEFLIYWQGFKSHTKKGMKMFGELLGLIFFMCVGEAPPCSSFVSLGRHSPTFSRPALPTHSSECRNEAQVCCLPLPAIDGQHSIDSNHPGPSHRVIGMTLS
jgi:hypothetical protein